MKAAVTKIRLEDLQEPSSLPSSAVADRDEPNDLDFDLGNLCYTDTTPVTELDDESLLQRARDNVQLLINRVVTLPILRDEKTELMRGKVYKLPEAGHNLPREKPIPRPKPLTRWEKFKKERGINTRKKDKMVFDENTQKWKRRFGYDRANDPMLTPILEVSGDWKPGDEDPYSKLRREKKERGIKNKTHRAKNLLEAAGIRAPGTVDLLSAIEHSKKRPKKKKNGQPERTNKKSQAAAHVDLALKIAQHSTASMGKFDRMNRGEAKPSGPRALKQRKQIGRADEKDRGLDILNQVVGKKQTKHAFNKEKAGRIDKQMREKRRAKKNAASGKGGPKGKGMKRGLSGEKGGSRGKRKKR